ncbi:MAG: ATP-binding protein [Paludibacteraceae bacterium]|nr:ATP-binding protein [Paludibacteraceae bacterium]
MVTMKKGKKKRTQLEVDFVVNQTDKRYYIQSALTVADKEKRQQEINSLNRINASYTKLVVVHDNILPWIDEKGVQYINFEDFLLEKINEL